MGHEAQARAGLRRIALWVGTWAAGVLPAAWGRPGQAETTQARPGRDDAGGGPSLVDV